MLPGLDGVAELLWKLKLRNFAKWRWGTLADVCQNLSTVFETLCGVFDATPFLKNRDQVSLKKVVFALSSPVWKSQFRFVTWYTVWLNRISEWGGGCDCHNDALIAGEAIDCDRKGRRLLRAFVYASGELKSGLEVANAWPAAKFLGGMPVLQVLQGCVRYVFNVGMQKLDFLDRIPLLCVRLRQPGVRDRAVAQWEASDKTDDASAEFFVFMAVDIANIHDDGITVSNISDRLGKAIDSLENIPINDTVGEGPHAIANAISQRSRGCSWSFTASTMRFVHLLANLA